MKLAIISHTEHYRNQDGTIVGWGPTINEINHLTEIFEEVIHMAMLKEGESPASALPYTSKRIKFVALPSVGGTSILSKIQILWNAPKTLKIVYTQLKLVDVFQLRTPTGIGVYLIPFLTLCIKKKGWFKYAGNWNQKKPPLGYSIQRWLLKRQNRFVTINGSWPDQPLQCLTFENPCLTVRDIEKGNEVIKNKVKNIKLTFCFVGRLERAKGVERIIKAFEGLSSNEKKEIDKVYLIGDGPERQYFEQLSNKSEIQFDFKGFLSRLDVFKIYGESDVFLLPSSASEGFPKVISEAMNFGCIPVVSNVSSITQYIQNNQNGFVIDPLTVTNLTAIIRKIILMPNTQFNNMMQSNSEILQKFSYQYYNKRIMNDIFKNKNNTNR